MDEIMKGTDECSASIVTRPESNALGKLGGVYEVECIGVDGKLKWKDTIKNTITDVGANYVLDHAFGGAQNTAYYLGLISSASYTVPPAVGNTMASHSGWYEAGAASTYFPNWSTPASNARAAVTWNAAGSRAKAIASAAQFIIATNGGTIKGCFIVTGSGAVATNADTGGTLYSAGTFTGGDRVVIVGDTVNVSYSTTLS